MTPTMNMGKTATTTTTPKPLPIRQFLILRAAIDVSNKRDVEETGNLIESVRPTRHLGISVIYPPAP